MPLSGSHHRKGNRQVAEPPKFCQCSSTNFSTFKILTYKKSLQYHILLRFLSPPSTPKKEQHYVAMFVISDSFIQTSIKMDKDTHHPQHHHKHGMMGKDDGKLYNSLPIHFGKSHHFISCHPTPGLFSIASSAAVAKARASKSLASGPVVSRVV